jgi:hypothetical protein
MSSTRFVPTLQAALLLGGCLLAQEPAAVSDPRNIKTGDKTWRIAQGLDGEIRLLRIYGSTKDFRGHRRVSNSLTGPVLDWGFNDKQRL